MAVSPSRPEAFADTVATDVGSEAFGRSRTFTDSLAEGEEAGQVLPGTSIGRYMVLGRLGAGAMGVVYAAYDPKLNRKVALKRIVSRSTPEARLRLEREAQALAKLAHPHVVAIYDVDVHDEQFHVAMEFVAGQTLGGWMREAKREGKPRSWPEVLPVFTDAGRGLGAAHAAGLVHRDFKPENVMLGDDGRVRVMDFGLARPDVHTKPLAKVQPAMLADPNLLSTPMTQTGAMVGTPAYMAPEQFVGEADTRSDQFAFCVTLYEALYGLRPFMGKDLRELLENIEMRRFAPVTTPAPIPAWLRAVVVRGLAADPRQRWPSMEALLEALAKDPALRRRRWAAAAVITGLVGASAALAIGSVQQPEATACAGFESHFEGIWDEAHREQLHETLAGTQLSYADETWSRVEHHLDRYAQSWVGARREACEATQRGEQSGELLDLRMRCLDDRLHHVEATVAVLEEADEEVVGKAVEAVLGLPNLDRCTDAKALRAELPPPEDARVAEAVAALDARLIEAVALQKAAKYSEGLAVAEAVLAEAETLAYEPLLVRSQLRVGDLQRNLGAHAESEKNLELAYASALGVGMLPEASVAATGLVFIVGDPQGRYDEARRWAKDAGPLARVVGTGEARADYHSSVGIVALAAAEYDEALLHLERALEIYTVEYGADHPTVAITLDNIGSAKSRAGRYAEARADLERAVAISEAALGHAHPIIAHILGSLGTVAWMQNEYDEARLYHTRALAIFEAGLGLEHMEVARACINLGLVARAQESFDEARALYQRAIAILDKTAEPDHPVLAEVLGNLGFLEQARGDYSAARGRYERALAISERTLDPNHPTIGGTLVNLGALSLEEGDLEKGRARLERGLAVFEVAVGTEHPHYAMASFSLGDAMLLQGQRAEARSRYERAQAILTKTLGPEHVLHAYVLLGLGRVALEEGAADEARVALERGLELSEGMEPYKRTALRFELGRALWGASVEGGRDRARAGKLIRGAAADYAAGGPNLAAKLAEVEAWQRAHPE